MNLNQNPRVERAEREERELEALLLERRIRREEYEASPEGQAEMARREAEFRAILQNGVPDDEGPGERWRPQATIAGMPATFIDHKAALEIPRAKRPTCSLCGSRMVAFYLCAGEAICLRCAGELGK